MLTMLSSPEDKSVRRRRLTAPLPTTASQTTTRGHANTSTSTMIMKPPVAKSSRKRCKQLKAVSVKHTMNNASGTQRATT